MKAVRYEQIHKQVVDKVDKGLVKRGENEVKGRDSIEFDSWCKLVRTWKVQKERTQGKDRDKQHIPQKFLHTKITKKLK